MNTLKTATSLLLGVLGSSPVLAVLTNPNTQTLGATAGRIDSWQLVCAGAGTSGARVRVTDIASSNNTGAQIMVTVGDFDSGDFEIAPNEGATSPWAVTGGGVGVYDVDFSKSSTGVDTYSGEALCDGGPEGTFTRTQNQ